jgi:hypothetical protein
MHLPASSTPGSTASARLVTVMPVGPLANGFRLPASSDSHPSAPRLACHRSAPFTKPRYSAPNTNPPVWYNSPAQPKLSCYHSQGGHMANASYGVASYRCRSYPPENRLGGCHASDAQSGRARSFPCCWRATPSDNCCSMALRTSNRLASLYSPKNVKRSCEKWVPSIVTNCHESITGECLVC